MEWQVLTQINLECKQYFQSELLEQANNRYWFYREENNLVVVTNLFLRDNVADLKKHTRKEKFEKVKRMQKLQKVESEKY